MNQARLRSRVVNTDVLSSDCSFSTGRCITPCKVTERNQRGLAGDLNTGIIGWEATLESRAEPYVCGTAMVDAVLCHRGLLRFPTNIQFRK